MGQTNKRDKERDANGKLENCLAKTKTPAVVNIAVSAAAPSREERDRYPKNKQTKTKTTTKDRRQATGSQPRQKQVGFEVVAAVCSCIDSVYL